MISGWLANFNAQMREAEIWLAEQTKKLEAEGYVNTIHDCWEKIEEEKPQ